MSLSAELAKPN